MCTLPVTSGRGAARRYRPGLSLSTVFESPPLTPAAISMAARSVHVPFDVTTSDKSRLALPTLQAASRLRGTSSGAAGWMRSSRSSTSIISLLGVGFFAFFAFFFFIFFPPTSSTCPSLDTAAATVLGGLPALVAASKWWAISKRVRRLMGRGHLLWSGPPPAAAAALRDVARSFGEVLIGSTSGLRPGTSDSPAI